MPQAKDREKVTADWVEASLDEAYTLREEYTNFLARRKANREDLRNLETRGHLSDDQRGELEELYPKRQRAEQEAEEASAAA